MGKSSFLRSALAAAAFLAAGDVAVAQMAECQRYQAELAALERGGGGQQSPAAERQRAEIARLSGYYRSIGCERGVLGGLFGGPSPAECGSISQRLQQMEANYASITAQGGGNTDARRRQLQTAIQQTCYAEAPAGSGPRGFFESLFGAPRGTVRPPEPGRLPENPEAAEGGERPLGGRRLVCVRSCDGFFFPLSTGTRENADSLCQALCPGTETSAFAMPGSDDALRSAISLRGTPYTSLPNAFKFQRSFDSSCGCKAETESWAQLLRRAEGMIGQKRGDILVTAEKSEELSRPKVVTAQAQPQDKKAADKKAKEQAESDEAAELGAAAPTASKESSGIGPQSIETNRVVGTQEGPRQTVTVGDGSKRPVRVIAPNLIPVPEMRQ